LENDDNQKTGVKNTGLEKTDNIAEMEFAGVENAGLHQYGLTLRCLQYSAYILIIAVD